MSKNLKTVLIIGGIVLATLTIVPLIFGITSGWQGYGYGMMSMMGGFGWMWQMQVDENSAAATSDYKGEKYYFCAMGCKKAFDAEPEKYLSK